MSVPHFSHDQLLSAGTFHAADLAAIHTRRRAHNRLGFAYQLAFVRLTNRFPTQHPLEIVEELLVYVSAQLGIARDAIERYQQRQQTVADHRSDLLDYLHWRRFGDAEVQQLKTFLFAQACRLEQPGPLLVQAKQFLQTSGILFPADDTLQRLVITQRQAARAHIFRRLAESLSANLQEKLEALLHATGETRTLFQLLKQPPGNVSPKAMARLAEKLTRIRQTGLLQVDLRWLNNNYQRSLAHYAHRCSADRLCQLQPERRYAVLSCFLWQLYRDTIDYMLEMHAKLVQGVYQRVQEEIDAHTRQQRRMLRHSLKTLRVLGQIILDERIQDTQVRTALFNQVERDKLVAQMEVVEGWLTGKYSHVFHRVVQRFTYLRQFSPLLVDSLRFHQEEGASSSLVTAIDLLHEMNHTGKRKLPDDAPMAFIPEHLRSFVEQAGEPSKQAWECALLTALRDDIRAGNVYVQDSKRFGRFADFFISDSQWAAQREGFFQRAGLPSTADAVPEYLTRRLNQAYDHFLEHLPDNTYASVDERGWRLSVDPPHTLNEAEQERVAALQRWLGDQMQEIKLPDLLIAVDNDLHFTRHFLPSTPTARPADQVCELLATIIAHGCNIGPYTMSRLAGDISYTQIKWVTDWLLTEEAQRQALAEVVNAITAVGIISDPARFGWHSHNV